MPNYDINYDDKRFTQVESDKQEALTENEKTYDSMISGTDKFYNEQIDASKEWAETQKKNQQEQTDFAIEQIEQQKEQAKKDYTKEQSGAYVDWQKQSNQYGANAEQMAAQGVDKSGFAESSQVSMYNTYQNRVASARESYTRAVLNYDNAIKDARLQNNAVLAEIAYEALQKQLELSLQGFQYKNSLIQEKAKQKTTIDQNYYQRYLSVLDQINAENALAENARQFDESLAFQREQFNYQKSKDAASGGSATIKTKSGTTVKRNSNGLIEMPGSEGRLKGDNIDGSQTKKETKKETKEPTPNMDSVLALGYGPISASKLNSLVESGKVVEIEKDGQLYYQKVFAG